MPNRFVGNCERDSADMAVLTVNRNLLLHLLTENQLTRREIATRLGCSAERVRQLENKLLGRTGRQAQCERREPEARRLQAIFGKNVFVNAAKQRGLQVEPFMYGTLYCCKSKLYVNGKLCLLRRAYKNTGYKARYLTIRKPSQTAAICVLELGRKEFLIIPMAEMPKSTTMCSLVPSKRTYASSHNWRKYLNNWSVFIENRTRGHGQKSRHL